MNWLVNAQKDELLIQRIKQHEEAKANLEHWKEIEKQMRLALLAECFQYSEDLREGTQNYELSNGSKLKAVFKLNRKLDKDNVKESLDEIEALGPEYKFIADRIVKFNPELSLTEYKQAPVEVREIIDQILTTSSSLPSLELVEPKKKKTRV